MRVSIAATILFFLPVFGFADVVVTNAEDTVFYFAVGESTWEGVREQGLELRQIGAGGFVILDDSARNTPVTGFFFIPGRTSHPGVSLTLAGRAATVEVPDRPAFMVDAVVPPELTRPIRLDNRYLEWSRYQPVAQFPRFSRPSTVYRTSDIGSVTLSGEDSRFYGRGGSDLELVRMLRWQSDLYLMLSAYSGFSEGFSLFLYAYASEADTSARFTLQVSVSDTLPMVLLWRRSVAEPDVVGTFVRGSFFLEAIVWSDAMPEGFQLLDGIEFLEVSTAIADVGESEEFPLTRVMIDDIPREAR